MPHPADEYYAELTAMTQALADELGVSFSCAQDIRYLRTRSRHTPELESELIRLYAAGTPPNVCEFGVTAETQNRLLAEVQKIKTSLQ